MPKREPTPPPTEDEPNYLTILNPYPPNAQMDLQGDMCRLVQWLAAAMDNTDSLLALFHKPSSPRLVIIEVSKSYKNLRRLLGQHFWGGPSGILNVPLPATNFSAIFFCHYTTARDVEKNGWKRKWIEDDMFADPVTRNKVFKNPYPATTYISQAGQSDLTGVEFCRPLPVRYFPEIGGSKAVTLEAPVGSSVWATKKEHKHISPLERSEAPAADIPKGEPENLWAESYDHEVVPLISDLALASISGNNDADICPHHGTTCKKMCAWRVENEKKKGPKVGGPSNTKNYRPQNGRGYKSNRGRGNDDRTVLNSSTRSPSAVSSPGTIKQAPKVITRAPPPPPGLRPTPLVSPVKLDPSSSTSQDESVPQSPTPTAAANGPVRGAPVWASRGRGRGRA